LLALLRRRLRCRRRAYFAATVDGTEKSNIRAVMAPPVPPPVRA
jgi:hypothetical protein